VALFVAKVPLYEAKVAPHIAKVALYAAKAAPNSSLKSKPRL